ncbi:MAG: alpha-amylase, partial [Bacteroidales bacterium]|nr:alpha-amylase [Bacteroidales bacterium]
KLKAIAEIEVPDAISWADEERDITAWLGNELQQDAYNKLYEQTEKLSLVNDPVLWEDFGHLQESDHFYYMSTKFFSDGEVHSYFNPYNTPYEAFINYMNALSDFIIRIDDAVATFTRMSEANFKAGNPEAKAPAKTPKPKTTKTAKTVKTVKKK